MQLMCNRVMVALIRPTATTVRPRWKLPLSHRRLLLRGVKGREQVPQLIDRSLAGEIDVDPFLSHRILLDEVAAASS
jgi:Zn-dependent alcohol dehydrogenase